MVSVPCNFSSVAVGEGVVIASLVVGIGGNGERVGVFSFWVQALSKENMLTIIRAFRMNCLIVFPFQDIFFLIEVDFRAIATGGLYYTRIVKDGQCFKSSIIHFVMPSDNTSLNKTQFLLTNLLLLFVFIFLISLGIAFYLSRGTTTSVGELFTATPTPEVAMISPTPTISSTWQRASFPSLTPTPSSTVSPTLSPTWSPTPVGPPTLTPARPLPQPDRYQLKTWNEALADELVKMMEYFPYTLPPNQRESDDPLFYQQFQYAAFARQEALLRFPQSAYRQGWEWGLAYDLARMGDASVGEQYAALIVSGLNGEETDIPQLYLWFKQHEPRLDLFMVQLDEVPGFFENYLIEIRGGGSMFIWLLRGSAGYRAIALESRFDFINLPSADWIYADLDGLPENGREVLIYYRQNQDGSVPPPSVYQLHRLPAYKMPFFPQPYLFNIQLPYMPQWVVRAGIDAAPQIVFRTQVFPACPVLLQRAYQWDGDNYSFVALEDTLAEDVQDFSLCPFILQHAVLHWDIHATVALLEALMQEWSPDGEGSEASPLLEFKDELRYRLGVSYALIGQEEKAKRYLHDLLDEPSISTSRWIGPAREFLQAYRTATDVYRACALSELCDAGKALEYLVHRIEATQDVLSELWKYGVQSGSSGYFDFEQDKQPERWFTVRHRPLSDLELWALFPYRSGVKAVQIATVQSLQPRLELLDQAYIDPADLPLQPAILLEGKYAFHIRRLPGSKEAYLVDVRFRKEYPNQFELALEDAIRGLFAGQSARSVVEQLSDLEKWPGLLCRASWTCDKYYYFLGLARELAGDTKGAIEAYHRLWIDYSRSPFTLMARMKLIPPPSTPTPTPTQSPTPSLTFTPTVTFTSTPTPSGTITPASPTASITSTATVSGTVTPGTPSATATMTPTPSETSEAYPPIPTPTTSSSPYP